MAFTMPEIFKISVAAACPSHSRTDVTARQHTIVIDEPPHRGGTDVAQTPLETLLASFLGCNNVIANMIAEDIGIEATRSAGSRRRAFPSSSPSRTSISCSA